MHKTLTKQMLFRAALKRFAMTMAIILSVVYIAFIIFGFAWDNDLTTGEILLFPLGMVLFLFFVFMFVSSLGKIGYTRFITKQERALQVSFSEDMSKEGIMYKGFRVKKYISDNWFIFNLEIIHSNYIARVDNLNTRIRAGNTGGHSMVIKATCIDGERFEIETDDCTFDEFLEWYAKVKPEDPMWKKEYQHRASLEDRNIPEGWMAPRKKKK